MNDDLGFIHRFVPPDGPATGDTLVVLHGTGGDENDLIGIGQAVAPGAAILSPRGNVLENGAPRFFKRRAEGVFDPKEVRRGAEELARFVRGAAVTYRFDEARVFALGFSNGANVAATVMLVEPEIFQGAVLLRPMLVYEPSERSDLSGKAALISAGRLDPIVPAESVEALVRLFESAGADVTLKWQLTGHNLVPTEIRESADWLALHRAPV